LSPAPAWAGGAVDAAGGGVRVVMVTA
jgi:hypothetical protein